MSKEETHIGYKTEEIMLEIQNEVELNYKKSQSWIESLAEYCTKYDVEEHNIVKYLSPALVERIKSEAKQLNLIKKDKFDIELPF